MSVEILAAVVLVGGLVDLALLLFAMNPGRDAASSDKWTGSVAGGRTDVRARGPRHRTLFVAASEGDPRDLAPQAVAAALRSVEPRVEPGSRAERTPDVAPPGAALPTLPEATVREPARSDLPAPDGPATRAASAERGPAIVARMNLASQAFGLADSNLPVDETPGVEGALGWARIVEVEGARLLRYRRPVTAVIAEVDGLPRLVDRLGDEPVRRLLVVVGDVFRREARSSDWVASIAPGRYAVLLAETDESGADYYAERVRRVCEPWLGSAVVPLALAMGWSGAPASSDLQFALHRAEERMHADRRAVGRTARRLTRAAMREDAPDGAGDTAGTGRSVSPAGTDQPAIWAADAEPDERG